MGRRSRSRVRRDRDAATRSKRKRCSSSSSSSSATPSPPPPKRKRKVKAPENVSTQSITLNSMIPEFNPLTDNVTSWLNIIKSYSTTFSWTDSMVRYQALNKLKGSAKIWYDSLLRTNNDWTTWVWADWEKKIATTFQIRRNMFQLLKEILDNKPFENQSLYEFFFEQKCKIDRLCLNFTEQDIVSIILGNIGDNNLRSSVEASNCNTCDNLAGFLHSRIHKTTNSKFVSYKKDSHFKQAATIVQPSTSQSSMPMVTKQSDNSHQKPISCFTCGGAHKRAQCDVKCNFCSRKGHVEINCFKKKNQEAAKQETNCVVSSNSKKKFHKRLMLNEFSHDAFIDTGSSCSLIVASIVEKYALQKYTLEIPVLLQGFSKESQKTITQAVKVDIQLDSVHIKDVEMYVIDELTGCEILIGRNVTERSDLMYSRIADQLTFDYAEKFTNFCNSISEVELDTDSHSSELVVLFRKYEDCVSQTIDKLGKVNEYEMKISLLDNRPIQCRPYRASHADRSVIRKTVEELKDNDIIRDSNSSYASPALLVSKKDGQKRLCIDYRALNKITAKDKYPMPRIEDLIDRLNGAKVFSNLDLKCGYYQLKMADDAIDKTAFITEDGHYEFLRLPFGLVNGPSFFQQVMNKVLGSLRFGKVIIFLDDLLLISETVDENLNLLETVLKIFREYGLTLNLKKCHFLKSEIEFLGYKITQDGIKPSEVKLTAVRDYPVPKTVHQLRQFLGLISYFRKFIRNCAVLSSPLTNLLKKDSTWKWEDEHNQCFLNLKSALTQDNILVIFDPEKDSVLYTDACREGIAGILMQVTDEGEKPVHYYSRQTTEDEKRYHSFELELLAIVASLQKFRLYLLGSEFKIVTDCNAVRFALTKKEIIPRISRWVLATQEFDYNIVHREGRRMQHVDALSRNPVQSGEKSEAEIIMSITEADWLLSVQIQDPKLTEIRKALESGESEKHKHIYKNYELLGNKVYRRTARGRRWVVPKKCIWQVIKYNHDDLGHFAEDKTVERLEYQYWFPRMRRTVKKYIKNCLNCIYNKNKHGRKEGELFPVPKYAQPFHTLHLDHLGPFVKSLKGNKYLLVMVDAFTKFVFISAVRNTDASNVIKELKSLSKIFGHCRRLVTDAGSCFTSHDFIKYCTDSNIRLHTVATGMPRSNGQVERFNKTILEAMRAMGASVSDDRWDECIPILQQAMNSTYHKTIKAVPSEVFFGYRLRTDSDRLAPEQDSDHAIDVTKLRSWVDENIKQSATQQKERFDSTRMKARQYTEGDLVLLKIQSQSNDGRSKKMLPVFKGPFQIKKVLGHDRYEVVDMRGSERCNKPYIGTAAAENMKPWIRIDDWTTE
ncbi:hypothetical protein JYU34_011480 [Plutella xylostella]|uniref:RNA-directed DNA polymerase n=1 Tax=Plutella xylostella TaxID=51655 RepID=A0ABQ7QH44_PLUXY|nr:hypothetical protein JYU34_011480 [Plutella xylostella]